MASNGTLDNHFMSAAHSLNQERSHKSNHLTEVLWVSLVLVVCRVALEGQRSVTSELGQDPAIKQAVDSISTLALQIQRKSANEWNELIQVVLQGSSLRQSKGDVCLGGSNLKQADGSTIPHTPSTATFKEPVTVELLGQHPQCCLPIPSHLTGRAHLLLFFVRLFHP
eukprot:3888731-Amphidinium_carterae.1